MVENRYMVQKEQSQEQFKKAQQFVALESSFKNGISWLYWIAGLSLVNMIVFIAGGGLSFLAGLGITELFTGFVYGFYLSLGNVAQGTPLLEALGVGGVVIISIFSIAAALLFVIIGLVSKKKRSPTVMIFGIVLYALDTILVLLAGALLYFLFHLFALYGLWQGYVALKKLRALSQLSADKAVENPSA